MEKRAPIFFFAPFVSSTMAVAPAWIDYNGHMNMAYYHVLFDKAVEEGFSLVGLGQDYLEERKGSFFAAETHTLYKRELKAGDPVRVTLQLVDFDEKRVHFYLEIRHATEGWVAATSEGLSLHMDMRARKVAPFPDDIMANLAVMKAAHGRLAKPPVLGRVIGIPNKAGINEPLLVSGTRH
ncbi:thioesterase family protein [Microvirga alba]|uniref:Thioesterase family protein n=1 Tax=Microvirga alba TaxID=2791025 RepID=A0A931FN03_9HYPH|nr:thioesterase family protein [Microvirga alba]MBF9233569.1 thioesterase family protein [Microvirga alba]